MNTEQARFNMIEQQIRTWEVLDPTVLNLLHQVPRENFVPSIYRGLAFADLEIPLDQGQYMLSPKLEARMLQSLNLKTSDAVLEIGSGSGYMTALLASLANHVRSIELHQELSLYAADRLAAHNISNISLEVGNGVIGQKDSLYDVIVLTGSVAVMPQNLLQQLKPGGRLLAIVGQAPVMEAILVNCVMNGTYRHTVLFETSIPPLDDTMQTEQFSF